MPKTFKRVILYARQQRENKEVMDTLEQVFAHLQPNHAVFIDPDTIGGSTLQIPVLAHDELNAETDVLLVVGGDGSLLSAAQIAIHHDLPVIGINRGHLGFLTDILPQDFAPQLDNILKGMYRKEMRSLLTMQLFEDKKVCFEAHALNDVVLSRGSETRLITFDVYVDDQFVSHYRSDGLILATPTGSTAYALSAGGPILHPQLDAMVMVPMFSHSFSARPLVIDGNSHISLHISPQNDRSLQVSCDGHKSSAVAPDQFISIRKSQRSLQLLHPMDYRYYDTLRIKLGWGSEG